MAAQDEYAELRANLGEYKQQLQQLEELLLDEPENQDYQGLYHDVQEAITVTEAALAEFEAAQAGPSNSVPIEEGQSTRKRRSRFDAQERTSAAPGALPMQVLDQIRVAKARSALEGNAPMGWAIGFPCAARDASGHWSPASVTAVTPEGYFQILWKDGTGVPVTMHKADCRPRDAADYKGVNAPTRKAVEEVSQDAYARYLKGETIVIPTWMRIKDTDSEKQKEKKQRALKSLKKRIRFERKDLQSTKQANDWKAFQSGKGAKKKTGFLSTGKKQSMFAVPDNPNSRVGVIGSGKGMTNPASAKRTRLDF